MGPPSSQNTMHTHMQETNFGLVVNNTKLQPAPTIHLTSIQNEVCNNIESTILIVKTSPRFEMRGNWIHAGPSMVCQ